ncbi:MAG: cation-efflux pump [Candidatus Bathyarchaeia archaeon]
MSGEVRSPSKASAARSGVAAGLLLTTIELTGGLLSGSLALLSSAINTFMSLLASVLSLIAVREGGRPPDEEHPYGHEKVESFAAIGEVALLLVTCTWLLYSAANRLITGSAEIRFYWIALGTNLASIIIDSYAYTRLRKASRSEVSEALDAGALHFLNDLLIAFIVILGISLYGVGLWYADPLAATVVVAYTIYSGVDVFKRSVDILIDTAPRGLAEEIKKRILKVEGVQSCHRLRVRRAGSKHFVDVHVEVDGHVPLSKAHSISDAIESQINELLPEADVTIHAEPWTSGDPTSKIRRVASEIQGIKGIHEVGVSEVGGSLIVSYHLEMDPRTSLEKAHEVAEEMERRLREALGEGTVILSHLEPAEPPSAHKWVRPRETKELRRRILEAAEGYPEVMSVHEIRSLSSEEGLLITLHCMVEGSTPLERAHEISTMMEERIKAIDPRIKYVIIHCEPI